MSYIKANDVLPQYVIELIQRYVEGKNIYIPRKESSREGWGELSGARKELRHRNSKIYREYLDGAGTAQLAESYFLSEKSIQRIICQMKKDGSA